MRVIAQVRPDILVLTSFDYDYESHAIAAFADLLDVSGIRYPYHFTDAPNTGVTLDVDNDQDGRLRGPADNQSYGSFRGQGGMAVLSRWPIDVAGVQTLTDLLWHDFPEALLLPETDPEQRLSTTAHWDIPVLTPEHGTVRILAYHATPPVFDGPEDRNGRRNHDESALWLAWLDGALGGNPPSKRFVIAGDANLDPIDGDGRPAALNSILSDPRLQDPQPASAGGPAAATEQKGANLDHLGDPAFDTADWRDDVPGNLRVDYVLPSSDWNVMASGVFWPAPDDPMASLLGDEGVTTRHRLVWVDID